MLSSREEIDNRAESMKLLGVWIVNQVYDPDTSRLQHIGLVVQPQRKLDISWIIELGSDSVIS